MDILQGRLAPGAGAATLGAGRVSVDDVVSRLASGDSPAKLVASEKLIPADLVAALAHAALGFSESLGPPLVQSQPRVPALLSSLSEAAWAPLFPRTVHPLRLCLAAGLLQMHDFWDASHNAAQRADDLGESEFSAYWHGIAHRREPDAGNAGYWFRRVGQHATFKELAGRARSLLDQHGESQLAQRLIQGGTWNPTAMIELCTRASSGTPGEAIARRLQRLEMWLLLEATYAAVAGKTLA